MESTIQKVLLVPTVDQMPHSMAPLTLTADMTWSDGRDDLDGALDCEREPEKDGFDDTKGAPDTEGRSDATFDGTADTDGRYDLE